MSEQNVKAGAASILAKPPVFAYGSTTEDITDKALTSEQLRIDKSKNFPELDDGKRVSWAMEYGIITKQVPKPKETVIHKRKELTCKVKPRIIAQSKGKVSTYKGVFTSLEDAEQSDKVIKFLPSRDGRVYEICCTEAGQFIVPVTDVPKLSEVSAGFSGAAPDSVPTYLSSDLVFPCSSSFLPARRICRGIFSLDKPYTGAKMIGG